MKQKCHLSLNVGDLPQSRQICVLFAAFVSFELGHCFLDFVGVTDSWAVRF